MTRTKPVGSAEAAVLHRLANLSGGWTKRDGVLWESKFWTVKILQTLATKGLVEEVVCEAHYRLTAQGERVRKSLAAPVLAVRHVQRPRPIVSEPRVLPHVRHTRPPGRSTY